MSITSTTILHLSSRPMPLQFHHKLNPSRSASNQCLRLRRARRIRCYSDEKKWEESSGINRDYYELLGVPVDSTMQEIKEAYRKLQKKYHPDVAGDKGHEFTLLLNEAYQALRRDELRKKYDASSGRRRVGFESNFSGSTYSAWNGPLRPQALFVDENKCIGCRECVHHASKTFVMDEALGCARVRVQFGDDEEKIEVSVDSCPMNCIYWVDNDDLALLEFLIRPQPKEAYGVFGEGWERPSDVFMAAKYFKKQLNQQQDQRHQEHNGRNQEPDTPAQAKARHDALQELQSQGGFSRIWSWLRKLRGS